MLPRIHNNAPRLAILTCVYNGENHLRAQLESFLHQSKNDFTLWLSDDGSCDSSQKIITRFTKEFPDIRLNFLNGPKKGVTANFLSLVCNSEIRADFFALSDQDDIWDTNKLERALRWLKTIPADTPALYCARTRLVDANNVEIGFSPLFTKPPGFTHALVQNIASGNTMVFNQAARQLLVEAGPDVTVPIHDWWIYLAISACGGTVFYDPVPTLRYRQHDNNLIGINSSWKARIKRLYWLGQGRFRAWSDANITALRRLEHRITSENREILEKFCCAREVALPSRLILLLQSGVYRQTFLENAALFAAAVFKKI